MDVFPKASVAVNSTVVGPAGKVEPLAGPPVWATVTEEQESVADGIEKATTAEHVPGSDGTERSSGQSITGRDVSETVAVKEQITGGLA